MSKPNYHKKQHSNETRMSKNVSKDTQQMPQPRSTALPRHTKRRWNEEQLMKKKKKKRKKEKTKQNQQQQ